MSPLYCLTSDVYEESHSEQVNAMCESGVKLIQIRSKNLSKNQLFEEVSYASEICAKFGATLIVNDAIDVATATNASGVHLGVFDDCAKMARVELGEEKLIGETVHSYQDASAVKSRGVCDYVGLGPFRKSSTKRELIPSLSRDDYIRIIQFLEPTPCYLIGGIELGDFSLLTTLGLHGICVCSNLSDSKNFGVNLSKFVKATEDYLKN